jgi:hypothetical protein
VQADLRRVSEDHPRVVAVLGERPQQRFRRGRPAQQVEAAAEQHGRGGGERADQRLQARAHPGAVPVRARRLAGRGEPEQVAALGVVEEQRARQGVDDLG